MESNDNDIPPSSSTSSTTMADPNPNPSTSPQKPTDQNVVHDNPVPNSDPPVSSTPLNPNPNPTPIPVLPPPPQIQSFAPPPQVSAVPPPSFRPATPPVPLPTAPQFSPLPNAASFPVQVQPPGVSPLPVMVSPASGVVGSVAPQYLQVNNPAGLRMYAPMPNGYSIPPPQGTIPPPGILRYPPPYASMLRPAFPPRPPGAVGMIPALQRPPILTVRGPILTRPMIIPSVTPTEKPQTTVYVGKIASTVENDFMLSVLQLCGPVKSWKRAQDPTSGALKGFGFCEFESAEGVLRALRLLTKLSIDGQELMLNVNEATKEYLKRYVAKKKENSKNVKATETEGNEKVEGSEPSLEKSEPPKPLVEDSKEDTKENRNEDKKEDDKDEANKENNDMTNFGLVTDEDKEADQEATQKLTDMIEERIRTKPLPPPPPPPQTASDVAGNSNMELPAKSRDADSDVDITRNDVAEDRNDEEMTSDSKPSSDHERPETNSPDRGRRTDRRSRDRERDMKREKERELERYEREREQERAKREREREYKIREDERRYRARLKEWESREKEKERARKQEREREKEKEEDRKYEILDQENDDGYSRKRKYKSSGEEREERKRRLREKEEDIADREKEEEEIAEAKRRAEEEKELQKEEKPVLEHLPHHESNGTEKLILPDKSNLESENKPVDMFSDGDSVHENDADNGVIVNNGPGDDSAVGSLASSDLRQSHNAPAKKLGFGLVGSGKRTAVPSVFHEEEDEDAHKDKKMRPLVPIDYSTEELQAVRDTTPAAPSPNLAAAAEFAKRIGNVNSKDEKPDSEKERSKRSHDRSSQRDRDRERDRNVEDANRNRDENRKEMGDRGHDKSKTPDNKKLLDAKQLIDTIPKTKEELFLYEINWNVYDKNGLHERMRPWISKKVTEFLGEEETSLVDYIVTSTQEHVKGAEMLDRLQSILDEEAEMFVLKMWRMLIFEIKRVETGLASRSKT